MAAYHRVDDLQADLQADCLYTGIRSGPNVRCRVWEAFTFTFLIPTHVMIREIIPGR